MKKRRHIEINFAPYSFARILKSLHPLSLACLFLGLMLFAIACLQGIALLQKNKALEYELQHIKVVSTPHFDDSHSAKASAVTIKQANAVNTAVKKLNFPWKKIFNALEAATPSSIALLSVEPDAKRNILRVTAEAKNSDGMIAYIETFNQQSFFSRAILTRHEINGQDTNKPIRFQFEAYWMDALE